MGSELPSEASAVQQKSYVTFTTLPENASREEEEGPEPTLTLLERRQLISGSLTTGFRTWEAALHLGAYLLSGPGQDLIKGKSILELGAGTGFLSILCAKQLGANHVTSTDGDEGVVEALKENLFLNGLDNEKQVLTSVLRWGQSVRGSWVVDDFEEHPYDTVIGADIVSGVRMCSYPWRPCAHKKFRHTTRPPVWRWWQQYACSSIFVQASKSLSPAPYAMSIPLSHSGKLAVSRNTATSTVLLSTDFDTVRNKFTIEEIPFDPVPLHQQKSLFYAKAVPFKILSITAPADES